MNRFINILLFLGIFLVSFSIKNEKVTAGIEWEKNEHDFGKIELKKPVSVNFVFKNPSMVPLVITSVEPSCGCTVAEYPKEPVKPGKAAAVTISYDAATTGYFKKSITVVSNASQSPSVLFISGGLRPRIPTGARNRLRGAALA